jgi:hypothetical protein
MVTFTWNTRGLSKSTVKACATIFLDDNYRTAQTTSKDIGIVYQNQAR